MSHVGILVIDDDEQSQEMLRHVLDAEGWSVRVAPVASQALAELATGAWNLAIASVGMTGLDGPLFHILRELALAPAVEAGRTRIRVLFLVPEAVAASAQPALERDGLPYEPKPFHLHDFLEKVSDLLIETQAIPAPIRRVRYDQKSRGRPKERPGSRDRRNTAMFAAREEYTMTEEEIAEFEKKEKEEEERKKKQKKQPWEQ